MGAEGGQRADSRKVPALPVTVRWGRSDSGPAARSGWGRGQSAGEDTALPSGSPSLLFRPEGEGIPADLGAPKPEGPVPPAHRKLPGCGVLRLGLAEPLGHQRTRFLVDPGTDASTRSALPHSVACFPWGGAVSAQGTAGRQPLSRGDRHGRGLGRGERGRQEDPWERSSSPVLSHSCPHPCRGWASVSPADRSSQGQGRHVGTGQPWAYCVQRPEARGSGIAQATWLESGRARSEATPAGAPRHAVRVLALGPLPAAALPPLTV